MNRKFKNMAGIQRAQFASKVSGMSFFNFSRISDNGLPSNIMRLSIKVGKNIGAKKN